MKTEDMQTMFQALIEHLQQMDFSFGRRQHGHLTKILAESLALLIFKHQNRYKPSKYKRKFAKRKELV